MIKREKMNIEEIKKYLWCEQIKNVIQWSIRGTRSGELSIEKPEMWHLYLWRGNVKSEPTGWGRTTFVKRWDQLVDEGYITEGLRMEGYIDKEKIPDLIDRVYREIIKIKHGINLVVPGSVLTDIDALIEKTYQNIYKEYY